MIPRRRLLAGLLILAGVPARAADAGITPAEKARIEALLADIAATPGAVFIRNGSEHDPASAVKFFRAKWDKHGRDVRTAEEFIERLASRSSTTGQAYQIRLADGAVRPCADYLRERLAALKQ